MSVEAVLKCVCETTGEGPHWDERTQSLLFVDITCGTVHRWNSATGQHDTHKFDKDVSFIIPCSSGGYIVGLGQSLVRFDWDTKAVTVLHTVDAGKDTRFNDGKCDVRGRLWAGTMGNEVVPATPALHQGSLYSLAPDGTLQTQKEGVSISNGLAWTANGKTMYYIDSIPRKVYGYDYDMENGAISNERVCVDFGDKDTMPTLGLPDGMAIDTEDKIWVACYSAGKVIRFDPETGKELRTIDIPARRTTSCCFGGKNYDEMYITCGIWGADEEEIAKYPLSGSVFKVTGLGVKGLPAPMYDMK